MVGGDLAKPRVFETRGDLERTGPEYHPVVDVAHGPENVCHPRTDMSPPPLVVQRLGENLGLPQVVARSGKLTEQKQL